MLRSAEKVFAERLQDYDYVALLHCLRSSQSLQHLETLVTKTWHDRRDPLSVLIGQNLHNRQNVMRGAGAGMGGGDGYASEWY